MQHKGLQEEGVKIFSLELRAAQKKDVFQVKADNQLTLLVLHLAHLIPITCTACYRGLATPSCHIQIRFAFIAFTFHF